LKADIRISGDWDLPAIVFNEAGSRLGREEIWSMINYTYIRGRENMYRENSRGFTLIELMLVVIIIGVLVGMVMPRLVGKSEQAKRSVAQADIEANIASALELYEVDNGNFPTTDQGLAALRAKPSGNPVPKNWNGPYLKKEPLDPWGTAYAYKSPGEHNSDSYDLLSKGKDAIESTEDDIENWDK